MSIAPNIRTGLYIDNAKPRHEEGKHHLTHRLVEGYYA